MRIPSSTKKPVGWSVVMRDVLPAGRSGSQPSFTAKTYLSRKPRTKTGIEMPSSDPPMDRLSTHDCRGAGRRRSRAGCRRRRRRASRRRPARPWPGSGRGSPPGPAAGSGWTRRSRPARPCPCTRRTARTRAGPGRTPPAPLRPAPASPAPRGGPSPVRRAGPGPTGRPGSTAPAGSGSSRSRRRTANLSKVRSAAQRDLGEVLDAHRAGHVALDVLGERERRLGVRVRHTRQELHDLLVAGLVQRGRAWPRPAPARAASRSV